MVVGFVLFFLAGVGFGFAAPGVWKLAPFAFPILLALGTILRDGVEGEVLLRLLIALVVTGVGIVLGWLLEERSGGQAESAH